MNIQEIEQESMQGQKNLILNITYRLKFFDVVVRQNVHLL